MRARARATGPTDCRVDEENALEKYREYKTSYSTNVLSVRRVARRGGGHREQTYIDEAKSQQWFREKYHPDVCDARNAELVAAAQRRLAVFLSLKAQVQPCRAALPLSHRRACLSGRR